MKVLKALDAFTVYMLTRIESEYRGVKMGIAFTKFLFSMQFFMCSYQNDDHKDKSGVTPCIYGERGAGKRERE